MIPRLYLAPHDTASGDQRVPADPKRIGDDVGTLSDEGRGVEFVSIELTQRCMPLDLTERRFVAVEHPPRLILRPFAARSTNRG